MDGTSPSRTPPGSAQSSTEILPKPAGFFIFKYSQQANKHIYKWLVAATHSPHVDEDRPPAVAEPLASDDAHAFPTPIETVLLAVAAPPAVYVPTSSLFPLSQGKGEEAGGLPATEQGTVNGYPQQRKTTFYMQ